MEAAARVKGNNEQAVQLLPARRLGSRSILRPFLRNGTAMAGTTLLFALLAMAAIGPSLIPWDPFTMDALDRMGGPSSAHWMGTDELGRDTLARVVHGSRASLMVSVGSIALALILGSVPGLVAGFFRGRLEEMLMRVMDLILAFPAIVLGIAIVSVLGPGQINLIWAIAIVYTPVFARVARGSTLAVRELDYNEATKRSAGQ